MTKSLIRFFRQLLTKLLWLISIIVIIFVLLLSVIKLSLPYWIDNKARMVALVEDTFGGDFDYSQLELDWSEFKPTLFIKDGQWVAADDSMQYKAATSRVVLNFWQSLFKGYLIAESIELNDVSAEISIPDSNYPQWQNNFDLGLLLKRYPEAINQESIQINHLALTVHKEQQSRRGQISTLSFTKLNHQRQLIVEFQSDFTSQAKFVVETKGPLFKKDSTINIYGLLRDFDFSDSAQFFELPKDIPIELADTELWLNYKGKTPQSGRLIFQAGSSSSSVAKLDADINYARKDDFLIFSSNNFHVVERYKNDELKEYNSRFKVERKTEDDNSYYWHINAENTPLGYISALMIPFIPPDFSAELVQIQPKGDLISLDIEAEQQGQTITPIDGSAELINFSSQPTASIPGINLQSVHINSQNSGWNIIAKSVDSTINWPGVFAQPIPIETMQIDSWVGFSDQQFIRINNFSLDNPDTSTKAYGTLQLLDDDINLSLHAESQDVDMAALYKYWPRNKMDDEVLEFLDRAFVAGNVEFSQLTWRGSLEDFPYVHNEGQFNIRAEIADAQLKFDPEWPDAENLSAGVEFDNNQLLIEAFKGNVLGNDIGQVEGVIESLFTPGSILNLDISNQVSYVNYRNLFFQSPLQQWLGKELIDLKFNGALAHQLLMRIPLSDANDEFSLEGAINFNGQDIQLASYGLGLNNIQGWLHYTQAGVYAEQLKATLWENPVNIDIKVDEYTNNADLADINASSQFDLAKAVASLNLQLPIKVEGKSLVKLHYRRDSKGAESLIVRSDLKGTKIDGPPWLSKGKEESSAFLSTLYKKQSRIHARTIYRDTLSSQLHFSTEALNDINGVVAMGELATSSIKVPEQGVAIEGFFPEINSYEWINSLQVKKEGEFFWPQWIDHILVKTALFTVAGQSLHDVELRDSLLADDSVRFNVLAREGNGNLTLYKDGRKHVTIDKLDIELKPFSRISESELNIDKQALDNWQLECLSCEINGIDTGQLTLVSNLNNDTVVVKGDSQVEGQLSAYLEGRWQGDSSQVDVRFNTEDTGGLLKRWGYGDGVKETKASGEISLQWSGGFLDFSLKNLNGSINLETGEGAVKELSDRQARVFSLFSLQSIRRRLSLDFSDLFEDGFFFDKMVGKFTINDGVITSEDVFIDGVAADVRVRGSINLVEQTVDQNVTVVPKIGSSLPLLAGWAIEPTTGLIMLIVNKIFEPVVDVVVSIEYKVTGDLSNPTVVELSKKSKEVVVPEVNESELEAEKLKNKNDSPEGANLNKAESKAGKTEGGLKKSLKNSSKESSKERLSQTSTIDTSSEPDESMQPEQKATDSDGNNDE